VIFLDFDTAADKKTRRGGAIFQLAVVILREELRLKSLRFAPTAIQVLW